MGTSLRLPVHNYVLVSIMTKAERIRLVESRLNEYF